MRSESLKLRSEFEDKLTRELEQIQMVRTEANQKLRAAEDVLGRLEVRSPVTGKIVTMNYHTVGGVVAPAQPIMDIVPSGDHLRVEARIAPLDIDVVYPGLETDVRLTAFKSRTTPTIKGKLVDISGDLLEDRRTGQPYYLGVVEIDPDALAKLPNVTLKPGMPVDTIIKLKERTFLDYLIAPIEQSIVRSFRDGN